MAVEPMEFSNDPFAETPVEESDLGKAAAAQSASDAIIASTTVIADADPNDMFPSDTHVLLPGGLVINGVVYDEAEVRELTGEDEEALARTVNGSLFRYLNMIVELGLVSVGGIKATAEMRDSLLVGDRDTLLLGIRRATFGNEIEFLNVVCLACNETIGDVTIHLDTIPINTLSDRSVREFSVPLRKGGVAIIRLPNGADFMALGKNSTLSPAEQNTTLLSRCVLTVSGKNVGGATSLVNKLGVADRKAILKFIDDTQPGPRYDKIEFEHDDPDCGKITSLGINVMDLFREM